MSGRIVLVESSVAERILIKGILQSAHYTVAALPDVAAARIDLQGQPADVLLIDLTFAGTGALALIESLRAEGSPIAVIGLCPHADATRRIAALRAGVDDVLDRPVPEGLLLARIRSLLRQTDSRPGGDVADSAWRALGLAEDGAGFVPAGRVGLIARRHGALPPIISALVDRLPGGARLFAPGDDLGQAAPGQPLPDLYLIDALNEDGTTAAGLTAILADLRSRAVTRHAATLVLLPSGREHMAAMVLDLGADDLATPDTGPDELAHRVRTLLRRKAMADRRRDWVQIGLQAAITDSLTGLHNRRFAVAELGQMTQRAQAAGQPVAVMLLDIDHFKSVNDQHGHAAGDCVLVEFAARLRANLRAVDLVARIGGEEFLVAMPDTGLDGARGAAERLRRVIEMRPFALPDEPDGNGLRITMSIGVALCDDCSVRDIDALFARADRALYAAKSAGRNMVTIADTVAMTAA